VSPVKAIWETTIKASWEGVITKIMGRHDSSERSSRNDLKCLFSAQQRGEGGGGLPGNHGDVLKWNSMIKKGFSRGGVVGGKNEALFIEEKKNQKKHRRLQNLIFTGETEHYY